MEKSFDKNWENNVYSKGRYLNSYPYDILISIVVRKFFHIPKEERRKIKVLDLGCGAGNNAKFLAENGFDVYGIDGSETAIKVCKKRFKEWNLKGNFIQGDFLKLPYRDDFFDLIIDRESLYANSFTNIKKTIEEIRKKLRHNGLFVSFTYSSYHPDRKFGKLIKDNTYHDFKKGNCFYKTGVVHFVDIPEISELYSKFKIENVIRHSLDEVYDKPHKFMEFDEYIIITKKTEK